MDESRGSIASGERYDSLASDGRTSYPGVGLSVGVTRLLAPLLAEGRLRASRPVPTVVLVAVDAEETRAEAVAVAEQLRRRGIASEVAPAAERFGKQIRYADRRGIPFVWFGGRSAGEIKDPQRLQIPPTKRLATAGRRTAASGNRSAVPTSPTSCTRDWRQAAVSTARGRPRGALRACIQFARDIVAAVRAHPGETEARAASTGVVLRTHVLRPTWHPGRGRGQRWRLAAPAPCSADGQLYRREGWTRLRGSRNATITDALTACRPHPSGAESSWAPASSAGLQVMTRRWRSDRQRAIARGPAHL